MFSANGQSGTPWVYHLVDKVLTKDSVEYITKDCPTCAKVVIAVAPGIGYSADTGCVTQADLAHQVSRNFGSATLLPLQAPLPDSHSR